MTTTVRTQVKHRISLHTLGVISGLAAGVWLGAAEAPTKLVTAGFSPFAISLCMVAGVFTARWTFPTLLKGTSYVFADLGEPHEVTDTDIAIAEAHLMSGRPTEALSAATEAVEVAGTIGDYPHARALGGNSPRLRPPVCGGGTARRGAGRCLRSGRQSAATSTGTPSYRGLLGRR